MSKIAYLNSKYVRFNNAKVHIEDRGLQFSDSVYEVVSFYNRKLIVLRERLFVSNFFSSALKSCTAAFGSPEVPDENKTRPGFFLVLISS